MPAYWMRRTILFVVLSAGVLELPRSLGQVVVVGGTATTAIQGTPIGFAHSPLIATPDIALSGSGNAVGAPLSTAAANDSRTSLGPSVHNPNGPALFPITNYSAAPAPAAIPVALNSDESASSPGVVFENGLQHFESGLSEPANAARSVAEIAAVYRRQHEKAARSFNNDSIAEMNARALRNGSSELPPVSLAHFSPPPSDRELLIAQNHASALPQSDTDQSIAAQRSVQQVDSAANEEIPQATSQKLPEVGYTHDENAHATTNEIKAPARRSPAWFQLPGLILLAGLGVTGVLYWLKR